MQWFSALILFSPMLFIGGVFLLPYRKVRIFFLIYTLLLLAYFLFFPIKFFFPFIGFASLSFFSAYKHFFSLTLVLTLLTSLFTSHYLSPSRKDYWQWLSVFLLGMEFLFLGKNLFTQFIGWECLGLASYFLIGFWYKDYSNGGSAFFSLLLNRLGDLAFFFALLISLFFSPFPSIFYVLILIAGLTKSAQFPFWAWLPRAMSAPTTISALLHSATLVIAGVFLSIRYQIALPFLVDFIKFIAYTSIIIGGIYALTHKNIKEILAFSTISQIGYMFLAIALHLYDTASAYLIAHAIFKSGLFLLSLTIYKHIQSYNVEKYSLHIVEKIIAFLLLIQLIGIPFTQVYYLKTHFYSSAEQGDKIIFTLSNLLTTAYSVRLILYLLKAPFLKTKIKIQQKIELAFLLLLSVAGMALPLYLPVMQSKTSLPITLLKWTSILGGGLIGTFFYYNKITLPSFSRIFPFLFYSFLKINQFLYKVLEKTNIKLITRYIPHFFFKFISFINYLEKKVIEHTVSKIAQGFYLVGKIFFTVKNVQYYIFLSLSLIILISLLSYSLFYFFY